jgi:hypothetical protein
MSATIADSEATARDVDEFGHTHEQRVQANIEIWLMDYKYYGKRVSLSELRLEAESFLAAIHAANLSIVPTPQPGMVTITESLARDIEFILDLDTECRTEFSDEALESLRAAIAAAEPEGAKENTNG